MAHPFGSPSFSRNPYSGSAEFEGSRHFGRSRVFLVAIHGGHLAPIPRERNPMQRMGVVVLPANQTSEFDSSDLLPGVFRHPLPPVPPAPPMTQKNRLQPRPVRGEILRDPEGCLYEKIGQEIRPLHKLVAGSKGQVLELVPSRGPTFETRDPAADDELFASPQESESEDSLQRGGPRNQERELNQADPPPQSATENPKAASYRKLFPDPGQRRVIRLGDFKPLLAPQLAHPERVRDTHRLACYLQIYEVTKAQRLESLAAALGDAACVNQLQPMTESVARQLGLTPLSKIRPRVPAHFPREAGLLLPYERVFRLQLAQDPTTDDATPGREPARNSPIKAPAAADEQYSAPAPGRILKTAIPERYLKPWEFKLSRDEALYDMNVRATFADWFTSLSVWLKRWMGGRGELKKWQVLLSGKSADEQLWAVRPPRGAWAQPSIRDWARKTLEAAGYDSSTMLLEWEIFWRRKGV